jgi:hypothetical protein
MPVPPISTQAFLPDGAAFRAAVLGFRKVDATAYGAPRLGLAAPGNLLDRMD